MNKQHNKTSTIVIGGIIGAVIGVVAAYLINKSAELEGEDYKFSGKRASNFVVGTISLLWSLIGKGK